MESNFNQAVNFILRWEGGYVNDLNDPGGETKFGISKRAYPHLEISTLTEDQAKEIYHRDYWKKARCDELAVPLDMVVMDTAVNCGVSRALDFLKTTHQVESYLFLRLNHYCGLKTAKIYMNGWTKRVVSLWKEARGV